MLRLSLIALFLFTSLCMRAQTLSTTNYPIAECNGGTCPGVTTIKSHITCTFVDSLTETLYVGGQFRTLGGQTRIGIGAINGANGVLLPFAPVIDTFGCIYAIGIKGDTLFVGGRFSTVNGTARSNFAAIRISTGALLPSFNTGIGGAGDTVFAISVYQGRIYVGGKFTTVFGQARTNIARLNYNGTVNTWYPTGTGIVRKTQQSAGRIVMIEDVGVTDSRVVKYDTTTSPVPLVLLATTNSTSGNQYFQDFVIRNDSVYAVGNFYEVELVWLNGFAVARISNGNNRPWGISIPFNNPFSLRHRVSIEYYRDSLYIQIFDGSTQIQPYHKLCVVYFDDNAMRTMKIYNSNASGMNGWYGQNIIISNARLFEVERFAQHLAFPNGSNRCDIYSYCLKIPTLCGLWSSASYPPVCPGDTFWVSVLHEPYYASYVWSIGFGAVTLFPNGNSCMVVTGPSYTGCQVRVRGVTSCGVQNSSLRSMTIGFNPLPTVSAGVDDSVSCIVTSVTLYATGSSSFPPLMWSWSGPSGFSIADSIIVNAPGTYTVTLTDANGCSKSDYAYVFADTIPPTIVPFTAPTITCTNQSVTLDASSQYPNDSLRWIIGAGSYANPTTTAIPGNVLLVVTDRDNGCSSTDTIVITQNQVLPNAYVVYTDTLLTCTRDSVLLTGNSSTTGVTFYWLNSVSDTFADPVWVDTVGYYQLVATNMMNGCSTLVLSPYINGWYAPPNIIIATDSFNINCSYDSVLLSGSSLTLSATLQWTDSVLFSAANPAMTGTQGMYYLVATDTLNGCIAVDSAYVGFEATLDVTGYNDTAICPGSGAVLNVSPIGGTSPYAYQWNNAAGNTALVTVYPNDTLQYIVNVIDGAGCVGEDTVIVNVPDPILDSVLSFQPCDPLQPTGQIQIYPWGGVPPYQFSIDNGLSWQANGVFGGLTYGSYNVLIEDAIGCTQTATGIIDTNSLSPAPEFLVSTSPELGDTIVIVDISNPRPDSVQWNFPANTTIVDTSMFSPSIIPGDTGAFTISMHAFYGSCEVILTRLVNIQPFDSLNANAWSMNAIDSLILYPNPNSGVFTVHTELQGNQDFVILIYDELGNERGRQQVYDADAWTGQMSVNNPVPGNYILRVIAEFDSAEMIFVISQ